MLGRYEIGKEIIKLVEQYIGDRSAGERLIQSPIRKLDKIQKQLNLLHELERKAVEVMLDTRE